MPRPPVRATLRALLLIAALLWVPWAAVWLVDLEARSWFIPSAAAFLPYAAVATLTVLAIALIARAGRTALIALIGLAILLVPRIGRITTDPQPAANGPVLTVATTNVLIGRSDPERLARIVRQDNIDVLAVQENTGRWDARARRSSLRELLPHVVTIPGREGRADGLAIWSRLPINDAPPPPGDARSLGVTVRPPGAAAVQIRSVHPFPPFNDHNLQCWRTCTRALANAPRTNAPDTILAGDWNATLDHHPIRDLLASGFRDASEQHGLGWRPTWSNGTWAGLVIDHVLVSDRVAVQQVTAHDLLGSDHDVVVAQLRLPAMRSPS